jgi:mannose-6-phosphate isomerase-like protein (cupin superfamily)
MNDAPKWTVARIDEIEPRDTWIPIREHLGIRAFGINAYRRRENGEIINDHTEAASGQEELYVVLNGHAAFEVDGEQVDARAGTLVFAPPDAHRRASGDATVLVIGATPGEAYQSIDWGDAWPFHSKSLTAYGERRYADAVEAVKAGLAANPHHPGLHYNYACFATLAGDTGDDTFEHLRRAVELFPPFRGQARTDDDFASVRDDERFEEALR